MKLSTLVWPPQLQYPPHKAPAARVINFDLSRMVYEGPIATGGGHSDIYKDDVLHLLWAACEI